MIEIIVYLFFASVLTLLVTNALDISLEMDHKAIKTLAFTFTCITLMSLLGIFIVG